MRILCTGGSGFIGSRLGPALEAAGHHVTSIDRVDGDLVDPDAVYRLIADQHDLVVHLAAQPGRVFGEQDPGFTLKSNVLTTINVAQRCAEVGARLCYISTSEVYGDRSGLVSETTPVGRPLNLYAATKMWGEQVSQLYAPDGLTIIRPSMPYGPGMASGWGRAALPTMISNFLRGEPYIVHRGTARSWCYVDDIIRAIVKVITRSLDDTYNIYNVGRDDDLRMMVDVANLVCDVLDTPRDLVVFGKPDFSIKPVKDISMARLVRLGWNPSVGLEEGIRLTADAIVR